MDQAEKDKIIHKLIDAHRTISTMESCTAGLIASTITDTEGASAIFPGGYVTYLNETKVFICLLYTSPSPRDPKTSRMPSSA